MLLRIAKPIPGYAAGAAGPSENRPGTAITVIELQVAARFRRRGRNIQSCCVNNLFAVIVHRSQGAVRQRTCHEAVCRLLVSSPQIAGCDGAGDTAGYIFSGAPPAWSTRSRLCA